MNGMPTDKPFQQLLDFSRRRVSLVQQTQEILPLVRDVTAAIMWHIITFFGGDFRRQDASAVMAVPEAGVAR